VQKVHYGKETGSRGVFGVGCQCPYRQGCVPNVLGNDLRLGGVSVLSGANVQERIKRALLYHLSYAPILDENNTNGGVSAATVE